VGGIELNYMLPASAKGWLGAEEALVAYRVACHEVRWDDTLAQTQQLLQRCSYTVLVFAR
jgi:hypothetical protein